MCKQTNTNIIPEVDDTWKQLKKDELLTIVAKVKDCVGVDWADSRPEFESVAYVCDQCELVMRNGLSGDDLWATFRYSQSPEWYRKKLHRKHKKGTVIESMDPSDTVESWNDVRELEEDCPQDLIYRITDRKREALAEEQDATAETEAVAEADSEAVGVAVSEPTGGRYEWLDMDIDWGNANSYPRCNRPDSANENVYIPITRYWPGYTNNGWTLTGFVYADGAVLNTVTLPDEENERKGLQKQATKARFVKPIQ